MPALFRHACVGVAVAASAAISARTGSAHRAAYAGASAHARRRPPRRRPARAARAPARHPRDRATRVRSARPARGSRPTERGVSTWNGSAGAPASRPLAMSVVSVGNCAVCVPSARIINAQPGAISPPVKRPSARSASSVVAVPNVAISRCSPGNAACARSVRPSGRCRAGRASYSRSSRRTASDARIVVRGRPGQRASSSASSRAATSAPATFEIHAPRETRADQSGSAPPSRVWPNAPVSTSVRCASASARDPAVAGVDQQVRLVHCASRSDVAGGDRLHVRRIEQQLAGRVDARRDAARVRRPVRAARLRARVRVQRVPTRQERRASAPNCANAGVSAFSDAASVSVRLADAHAIDSAAGGTARERRFARAQPARRRLPRRAR